MKKVINIVLSALILLVFITGCDKTKVYDVAIPESVAHFTNSTGGTYFLLGPTITYKIPVGVTKAASVDRLISFTVTSPTGAVSGTHYTITGGNTIKIPAGKVIDSIEVKGVFAQYSAGRKDTLIFTLHEPDIKPSSYNSVYKLFMRGPCFEGDVTLSEFLGDYKNTKEQFGTANPYGPYKTSISQAISTGPTTGRITVTNIWDNGWGPITFDLDWTNPTNRTAIVVAQDVISGSDAGDINSTYAGQTLMARPVAGNPGTFSACNSTLTLKMQLGPSGIGFFGSVYTVNLVR